MALLTPLDRSAAAAIVQGYGLELTGFEPLAAGSVNSNFRVDTAQGRFFLRIYEEQPEAGALRELELLRGLAAAGVPTTVPPLRLDGASVSHHQGKPVALYPWVEGDIVCTERADAQRCEAVSAALARVHLAGASLPQQPASRFDVDALRQRLSLIQRDASSELCRAAKEIEALLPGVEQARVPDLPQGLIHGDLFRDNVLWSGDEVAALIDFESASQGVFAFDLMVLILSWCFRDHFDHDRVRAMLRGYQRVRPLSAEERRGLGGEGALACLRFATTRITDFSMRAAPGKPPVRDYRRFLQRLDELAQPELRELLERG
ncbi:MAG: homoserine kinase [Polyangiaceae bacterium]|nr:homoserine kinase [Myxococcales bacterium]MCB9583875.1 homoserine kinase [Polyangiaceae bacterium]MCB9607869.1 homoserine kinase [Polyangiaceae bacterium]